MKISNNRSIMPLTGLDINKLSGLLSPHVDQVTCIECCKFYTVPSTAPCGHTLCHGCWIGRRKCATCGSTVKRKSIKQNSLLQKMTQHTYEIRDHFEKIFKINWEDFLLMNQLENASSKDPIKHVRDWLANSENQFSTPENSQQSTQCFSNQQKEIGNKAEIHGETSKSISNKNIIHVEIPQDDWDKIEEIPDTEELHTKNKNSAIGPTDIEPFIVDQFEYTADNLRRSSRKRNVKGDMLQNIDNNSVDQNSTKDSTKETDSKTSKQNWANVKRMKKEFSKLNKISKRKLNVSIEMCKKTLISGKKNISVTNNNNSDDPELNIDDQTPDIDPKKCVPLTRNLEIRQSDNNNISENLEDIQSHNGIGSETQINPKTVHEINNVQINSLHIPYKPTTSLSPCRNKDQIPFIVKGALQDQSIEKECNCCTKNNLKTITVNTDNAEQTNSSDDIEITIKIGNNITNILIKKKEKDVQFKINTDREIQTSVEKCTLNNKNNHSCSHSKSVNQQNNIIVSVENNEQKTCQEKICLNSDKVSSSIKNSSSKKNTESAETATVQYEITESIEKELSKEMDKIEGLSQTTSKTKEKTNTKNVVSDNDIPGVNCLNELDLFDNNSVKTVNVHSLKSSNHAPSEILTSSLKSSRSKKQLDKRSRDDMLDDLPISKKMKVINKTKEIAKTTNKTKDLDHESEPINYDIIMDKVFANIDMDLGKTTDEKKNDNIVTPYNSKTTPKLFEPNHCESENVFSLIEKENDAIDKLASEKIETCIENKEKSSAKAVDCVEVMDEELGTPIQDNDKQSDESIVEETPQKRSSFRMVKQKSVGSSNAENTIKNKSLKLKRVGLDNAQTKSSNTSSIISVINLSDIADGTIRKSKQITVLENPRSRPTLETPLTITNFVEQIKHKSTPMAKKSLNFDSKSAEISDIVPEETLCPSLFIAAKTTQEKEFMREAFDDSTRTRSKNLLTMKYQIMTPKKFCLAGSCLTPGELANVKILCTIRKWDYVDRYTDDLTHLVVSVDDENKSQRSVKYMCALAASKWIVSYDWVDQCIEMQNAIDEEPFEALDNTGEPGPRRSRIAKKKLFQGMTFFCMPPFSMLDIDTLKGLLEAAGGRVVEKAKEVRVTGDSVALLLAEPEDTQDDRFIYLAMELGVVPVNSEWVLNCLGSYTLNSIQELLLCPESLLPPATARWPPELMTKDLD